MTGSPGRTFLLVGMHFRPPAKQVLEHLPAGALLMLRAEPDNPYDPAAVSVWISPSEVPEGQRPELDIKLPGTGTDPEDFWQTPEIMLGYLGASGGKPLVKAIQAEGQPLAGNGEALDEDGRLPTCRLTFGLSGLPLVKEISA